MYYFRDDEPNFMFEEFRKMLENRTYDSVEEMCNRLGLNYDDVYDYDALADWREKHNR